MKRIEIELTEEKGLIVKKGTLHPLEVIGLLELAKHAVLSNEEEVIDEDV